MNQVDYGQAKAGGASVDGEPRHRVGAGGACGSTRPPPGRTLTPMVQDMIDGSFGLPAIERCTPCGQLGDPAAIAGATVWLLCGATHVIGQCLPVDGGWTVVGR